MKLIKNSFFIIAILTVFKVYSVDNSNIWVKLKKERVIIAKQDEAYKNDTFKQWVEQTVKSAIIKTNLDGLRMISCEIGRPNNVKEVISVLKSSQNNYIHQYKILVYSNSSGELLAQNFVSMKQLLLDALIDKLENR